jgi:hypothetical protein
VKRTRLRIAFVDPAQRMKEIRPVAQRRSLFGRIVRIAVIATALVLLCLVYATQPLLWRGRPVDATVPVAPAALERHVRMLSQTLSPRDASNPYHLDDVANYIRVELERRGGRMTEQPYKAGGKMVRNVIASFGPEQGQRIIVGAHYDAFDKHPGADDNASGVAGLIELAGLLGKTDLESRIDLVAYTLEEPPHFATPSMGSYIHAEHLRTSGVPVRVMISLEMIGYFSDAEGSQAFPTPLLGALYPTTGNYITVTGNIGSAWLVRRIKAAMTRASDLPVHSLNGPAHAFGVDLSDQRNYWEFGYPAVMISDTAFHRNPNYHTAGDTADKLDYVRMAKVVWGVHAALKYYAGR